MDVHHFPLICWPLDRKSVCGLLVGTDLQVVGSDAKKVKSVVADRLRKDAEVDLPGRPPVTEFRLRTCEVTFRPSYREPDGVYPVPDAVTLPVAAVVGENGFGSYTCFLPLLGQSFYYYNPGQVDTLIRHFARDALVRLPPEAVHRLLTVGEPWLEDVMVRRKPSQEARRWRPPDPVVDTLSRVADRYPHAKKVQKKMTVFPSHAWERGTLVRVVQSFVDDDRANLLLVGDPGVGKSAVLLEAVRRIHRSAKGEEASFKPTFWKTDPFRMIASAQYLGDWQEICERLAEDLESIRGVLWLTQFIDLMRTGGEGPEDSVAAFLAPFLDRGAFQIVGEVTPSELDAARALLPGFVDRFQTVHIEEMARWQILKVFDRFRDYAEKNLSITLESEALETTHRLLDRFVKYERFPGKAIRFLVGALNEAHLERRPTVTQRAVLDAFVEQTGMPELLLRDDRLLDADTLASHFAGRILGQEDALEKVLSVVKVFKAGLNDPDKPVAALLFAGPTGVGKTATVRALAEYFFGAGSRLNPLIRLDMSEFQHPAQVGRLIGSGAGDPGRLVREIRERPFSVLLLDEIEKAHPAFFDALLSVLDEGRLVDAFGRVTDFRNAVVVMTTNLGTSNRPSLGFREEETFRVDDEIRSFFRPEFFNRIDRVLTFQPLNPDTVRAIARKELKETTAREGFRRRGIRLRFTENLVDWLSEEGFDPVYGARPLQRVIERRVVGPLAKHLLEHRDLKDCTLVLDRVEDRTHITCE
jgi:ATP-dependent Clp protease ATP-binding subunit ClpA